MKGIKDIVRSGNVLIHGLDLTQPKTVIQHFNVSVANQSRKRQDHCRIFCDKFQQEGSLLFHPFQDCPNDALVFGVFVAMLPTFLFQEDKGSVLDEGFIQFGTLTS